MVSYSAAKKKMGRLAYLIKTKFALQGWVFGVFFPDGFSCLQKEWELNNLVNSTPPSNFYEIGLQLKCLAGLSV